MKIKIKSFFEKVTSNRKLIRIVTPFILATVFMSFAFLVVNVFLYYAANKNAEDIPLYYNFKANTVKSSSDMSFLDADISEQFLSYEVSYGVDVSEWQGNIDWNKVKATGISFAMIRCGFRQTVGSEVIEDSKFRENIEGATAAGLKVGVYFFGTAKNQDEAREEAEFTINLIKDYNLTYPVVYDFEVFNRDRLAGVDNATITDNILTYTETVGSYGYETMIYSYHDALAHMLNTGKLEGKLIWLAHWVDKTNYRGNYHMWQYTDKGRVDGIRTNVDLNVSYFTYVDSEEEIVDNPNYIDAPKVAMAGVFETVKTKSNATMRTSPTTSMPNKLGTIPRGTILNRTGVSDDFSEVEYNGRIVYIENKYLTVVP